MKLYLTGGSQKNLGADLQEWERYERGLIVELDTESGTTEVVVSYVSPPEAIPDVEPSILFKTASRTSDRLYVCTQTEVLVYAIPGFDLVRYVSLSLFNDLHHVVQNRSGNLLIANTGLDVVMELDASNEIVREWGAVRQDPWKRFSREVDYRKVSTTKPHMSHPNFVFEVEDETWVTRFEQRDAVCLDRPNRRIAIDVERPHDGVVFGDEVYFTTVDGRIVVAELETCKAVRTYDLNDITRRLQILGWCRGLLVLEKDVVIVGFSRIRSTKHGANVSWIEKSIGKIKSLRSLPCRVALFDLGAGRLVWEHVVEEAGMNAIFGILPAGDF